MGIRGAGGYAASGAQCKPGYGLLADLDADEAEALRPADERLDAQARAMDAERAALDAKTVELERIAREEEGLLAEALA